MRGAAVRLVEALELVMGGEVPVRIRAWDGSEAGAEGEGVPVLVVRNRRAVRRLLFKPGELGLARAWVAGDIGVEGDLYRVLELLAGTIWERGEEAPGLAQLVRQEDFRRGVSGLVRLGGMPLPPSPPKEEARRVRHLHTRSTDRQAISHHYDVGNDFYALVLGPSMVYSCAYWGGGEETLEGAQGDKLDLVCRKLGVGEGQRVLDVGCGWGAFAVHAAREYGAQVVGVTLSQEQATFARKRVADAGLTELVEIRVQDYRDVDDGPYDAISSIGMAEHVGAERYLEYARQLYGLLGPGGRLLNHQIARRPQGDEAAYHVDSFIDAYVFPDGELAPIGTTVTQLERAGFEVRDVESIREHYALTLRRWVANLEDGWQRAVRLVSPGRARVWQLYMAASALAFERNRIGVNQVLAVRTPDSGASGLPLRSRVWSG